MQVTLALSHAGETEAVSQCGHAAHVPGGQSAAASTALRGPAHHASDPGPHAEAAGGHAGSVSTASHACHSSDPAGTTHLEAELQSSIWSPLPSYKGVHAGSAWLGHGQHQLDTRLTATSSLPLASWGAVRHLNTTDGAQGSGLAEETPQHTTQGSSAGQQFVQQAGQLSSQQRPPEQQQHPRPEQPSQRQQQQQQQAPSQLHAPQQGVQRPRASHRRSAWAQLDKLWEGRQEMLEQQRQRQEQYRQKQEQHRQRHQQEHQQPVQVQAPAEAPHLEGLSPGSASGKGPEATGREPYTRSARSQRPPQPVAAQWQPAPQPPTLAIPEPVQKAMSAILKATNLDDLQRELAQALRRQHGEGLTVIWSRLQLRAAASQQLAHVLALQRQAPSPAASLCAAALASCGHTGSVPWGSSCGDDGWSLGLESQQLMAHAMQDANGVTHDPGAFPPGDAAASGTGGIKAQLLGQLAAQRNGSLMFQEIGTAVLSDLKQLMSLQQSGRASDAPKGTAQAPQLANQENHVAYVAAAYLGACARARYQLPDRLAVGWARLLIRPHAKRHPILQVCTSHTLTTYGSRKTSKCLNHAQGLSLTHTGRGKGHHNSTLHKSSPHIHALQL